MTTVLNMVMLFAKFVKMDMFYKIIFVSPVPYIMILSVVIALINILALPVMKVMNFVMDLV